AAWAPRSPPRQGPADGALALVPQAVGPGPWPAGQGQPARESLPPRAALAGDLAAALAWAGTPGPGALAAAGLVTAVFYGTGRRTCGRRARPRTTTPAGSRAVRSGPRRCRYAAGRTPDRCGRPQTIRGAWTREAGSPADGGGRVAGTAAWVSTPGPAPAALG